MALAAEKRTVTFEPGTNFNTTSRAQTQLNRNRNRKRQQEAETARNEYHKIDKPPVTVTPLCQTYIPYTSSITVAEAQRALTATTCQEEAPKAGQIVFGFGASTLPDTRIPSLIMPLPRPATKLSASGMRAAATLFARKTGSQGSLNTIVIHDQEGNAFVHLTD